MTVTSVHIADVGVAASLKIVRNTPRPGSIPGLRHANVAIAAPLRTGAVSTPQFGRVALVAFWDDDDAISRFVGSQPLAAALAGGWSARLEPRRAWGTWPGLDADVTTSRRAEGDEPVVVLTLGRLRMSQAIRFFRTSAQAEQAAMRAPGMRWATALARPPFVATCSIWENAAASSTYAFGHNDAAHPGAIDEDTRKAFHHQSAFIRFRPYAVSGSLPGKNALVADAAAPTHA